MIVREAVLSFMENPHIEGLFGGEELIDYVRSCLPCWKKTFDGTILRELRLLRQQGKVNYRVICKKKSLYRKLK